MKRKEITLTFVLEAEDESFFPDAEQLASGIVEGIPREWFDAETPGDEYMIWDIVSADRPPVEDVTVFVSLMGGAFPGAIEGDIRVYDDYDNALIRPTHPGWVLFAEVPVQHIATTTSYDEGDTTT